MSVPREDALDLVVRVLRSVCPSVPWSHDDVTGFRSDTCEPAPWARADVPTEGDQCAGTLLLHGAAPRGSPDRCEGPSYLSAEVVVSQMGALSHLGALLAELYSDLDPATSGAAQSSQPADNVRRSSNPRVTQPQPVVDMSWMDSFPPL